MTKEDKYNYDLLLENISDKEDLIENLYKRYLYNLEKAKNHLKMLESYKKHCEETQECKYVGVSVIKNHWYKKR